MSTKNYAVKEKEYFSNIRIDVISLLPVNPGQKVLEVGAGAGSSLRYIKEKGLAAEVTGVELMKIPGSDQDHPSIDRFQIANIEHEEINAPKEYFDVVICADVLEHLIDPWTMVDKISAYLKKGGLLIVSLPNIRQWKASYRIFIKGDFAYLPEGQGGVMDKTHLRFFCKKNAWELLSRPQLNPVYCKPNFVVKALPQGRNARIINALTLRLFENLLAVQYLLIAEKK